MQYVSTQGWTLEDLLQQGQRFYPVPRSSCTSDDLADQIRRFEDSGTPIVIEGWHHHSRWPKNVFNIDFCSRNFRERNQTINVRNIHTRKDTTMPFDEFVEKSRSMPTFAVPEETERWYGKDVECPQQWEEWLVKERVLPENCLPEGPDDLLALRPKKNGRPDIETLMCYFGIADTFTPCHKDLCASSGQNLMCYTEGGGSSFWFMTKSKDCVCVAKYFQSLKHELDHETHVISVSDLANAPFDVYITEQKLGDLILVPPRSCHQVINFGGLSIKMSWSRMTLAGLAIAFYHELPLYRRVCRSEIYQIKNTTHHALCHYTQKLQELGSQSLESLPKKEVSQKLKNVLRIYDHILLEEYSSNGSSPSMQESRRRIRAADSETATSQIATDFLTCDFCGADIFQAYFQCQGQDCHSGEENFVVCPGCYVEGRTCTCGRMRERERQSFEVLFTTRWKAVEALKNAGQSMKRFEGTESLQEQQKYFSRPSERSVFRAAMLLHAARRGERQPRRTCRTKKPHPEPTSWTLPCKPCRTAKCYPHLIEGSRMHSLRALLLHGRDPSTKLYHNEHKEKFPEYDTEKQKLLLAQTEGTEFPDYNVLMIYNALTFPICQPINPQHASIGWYDKLPQAHHKRPEQSSKEKETHTALEPESRSSTSDPSKSVKNHAYVEVDRPQHRSIRQHSPGSKLGSSSPLSTSGRDTSGEESESDYSDFQTKTVKKRRLRRLDTTDSDEAIDTPLSKRKLSFKDSSFRPDRIHGVKKSNFGNTLTSQHNTSKKRPPDLRQDDATDGPVLAPAFSVGPPNKKRRQDYFEHEHKKQKDQKEQKLTASSLGVAKSKAPETFADALNAAINQVATTATRTRDSTSQDPRRKAENLKPGSNEGTTPTAAAATPLLQPPPVPQASPSSLISPSSKPFGQLQPGQTPILVNIAELQDMVVKMADRVVREKIGEVPNYLLAAHAAVSMMTGYAATGQFVNNNTQLQFPSMAYFGQVSNAGNTGVSNAMNNQAAQMSSSSTHQSHALTTNSNDPGAGGGIATNHHQPISKGRVRSVQAKGRSSSAVPDYHPHSPMIRKKSSLGSSRRVIDDEDEDD